MLVRQPNYSSHNAGEHDIEGGEVCPPRQTASIRFNGVKPRLGGVPVGGERGGSASLRDAHAQLSDLPCAIAVSSLHSARAAEQAETKHTQ